jgi:hypothetical protein
MNFIPKKWIDKILALVALVFGNAQKFEQFLIDHVDDAISIVSKIKAAVESPIILSFMGILPEKYRGAAGAVLATVEAVLNKVLDELQVSNTCLQLPSTAQRLKCFVDHMKTLSPAMREAVYFKFASLYTEGISGAPASRKAIDTAVQGRLYQYYTDPTTV